MLEKGCRLAPGRNCCSCQWRAGRDCNGFSSGGVVLVVVGVWGVVEGGGPNVRYCRPRCCHHCCWAGVWSCCRGLESWLRAGLALRSWLVALVRVAVVLQCGQEEA